MTKNCCSKMNDEAMEENQTLIDTAQSKWRSIAQLSLIEKIFLLISLVIIIVEVSLSIAKFAIDHSWSSDVIISVAILINVVFCAVYAMEGVFTTRPSQLLGFSSSLIFLCILLSGNYVIDHHHDDVQLAQMIIAIVGAIILFFPGLYYGIHYHKNKRLVVLTVGQSDVYWVLCEYLLASRDLRLLQVQAGVCIGVLTHLNNWYRVDPWILAMEVTYLVIWFFIGYHLLKKEQNPRSNIFVAAFGIFLILYPLIFAGRKINIIPGIAFAIILSSLAYTVAVAGVIICTVKLSRSFGSGMAMQLN